MNDNTATKILLTLSSIGFFFTWMITHSLYQVEKDKTRQLELLCQQQIKEHVVREYKLIRLEGGELR